MITRYKDIICVGLKTSVRGSKHVNLRVYIYLHIILMVKRDNFAKASFGGTKNVILWV